MTTLLIFCLLMKTDDQLTTALHTALPHPPQASKIRDLPVAEKLLLQEFIKNALRNEWNAETSNQLREFGWDLRKFLHQQTPVWLLTEREDARFGRGVLVIRPTSTNRFFVQAPHRFFDGRTGQILTDGFLRTDLRAAFWNTIHRRHVDLCHTRQETVCDVLTQSFAATIDDAFVVQIHGFDPAKRKTVVGRSADVILSGGTVEPVERHYNARLFIRRALPDANVLLFPVDVKTLGGTTNKQRQILPKPESFLHLEFSSDLRLRLQQDPQLSGEFLKQLFGLHRI